MRQFLVFLPRMENMALEKLTLLIDTSIQSLASVAVEEEMREGGATLGEALPPGEGNKSLSQRHDHNPGLKTESTSQSRSFPHDEGSSEITALSTKPRGPVKIVSERMTEACGSNAYVDVGDRDEIGSNSSFCWKNTLSGASRVNGNASQE